MFARSALSADNTACSTNHSGAANCAGKERSMAAVGAEIDPELRAAARLMQPLNLFYSAWGFRLMQRLLRARGTSIKDASLDFSERWIPRPDGTQLRICIFRPRRPQADVPGVLWLHGGGYAIGVPEQGLPMAKRLIELSNCVVVAPDYRLSVEAPYPAALNDCYTALLWLKTHATELGIRPDQLITAVDYHHLPPTITFVGELEPFCDETVQYVANLRAAGVPVHFARYPGCYHAFEQISPSARVSQAAVAFLLDAYQYAVAHYFAAQNRPAAGIAQQIAPA
jgi:acetyl esterase/lipase